MKKLLVLLLGFLFINNINSMNCTKGYKFKCKMNKLIKNQISRCGCFKS